MHPLTKIVLNAPFKEYEERIQSWAKERAEVLKKTAYDGVITPKMIDEAFQIKSESLEDKFNKSINLSKLYPALKEYGIITMFARIAEEHYKENKT